MPVVMTPELSALAAAVLLQAATIGLMAVVANRELGLRITTGPRDGPMPAVSPLLGRLMRTVSNGFEGLAMFAPAALIVALAGRSDPVTACAGWAYVAARLLYIPAYALGWRPWRSVFWGLGLLATLTLLVSALV